MSNQPLLIFCVMIGAIIGANLAWKVDSICAEADAKHFNLEACE